MENYELQTQNSLPLVTNEGQGEAFLPSILVILEKFGIKELKVMNVLILYWIKKLIDMVEINPNIMAQTILEKH